MSTLSRPEPSTAKSSQRLPPPFLFQGPSSRNTSNLSLPSNFLSGPHIPAKTPSVSGVKPPLPHHGSSSRVPQSSDVSDLSPSQGRSQGEIDSSDALWDQMQSTLAEVELSAVRGDQVFGHDHSKAVENLRAKQLALAQAWARGEAEEVAENLTPESDGTSAAANEEHPHRVLDEKTEKDILLARKRREANDRYFERVNNGVLDVVAKLEDVAQAMRDVASKSKEIWSENESIHSNG